MFPARKATLGLACAIVAAACGGAVAQAPASAVASSPPSSGSSLSPSVSPAASASSPTAPADAASATPQAILPPAPGPAPSGVAPVETAPIEMKGPVPTAMADALRDLGLDPKKLPPMEKLEPRALRGAMKLLAKSLGAKCVDCHTEGDFAAPTRRKKIAAHMWDDFAARLSMADGSPLFCDSCHQGRIRQLDRRDKKALAGWMDQNFVAKLAGSGARPVECETCHVDMEMLFLAKWGGSPPAR